ncbi:hypothetical protein GYD59_001932 [Salmonella enterica]|nr:hypothetical protein [Salmonella enterica]EEH2567232.1 hypothetical protein [Salmonella enterica]
MNSITKLAQRMREAAEQATAGPWFISEKGNNWNIDDGLGGDIALAKQRTPFATNPGQFDRTANAKFIALANPANVLALLDELENTEYQHDKDRSLLVAENARMERQIISMAQAYQNLQQLSEVYRCAYEEAKHDGLINWEAASSLNVENEDFKRHIPPLTTALAARGDIIERLIGQYSAAGLHAVQNSLNPGQALLYDAMQAIHQPEVNAVIGDLKAQGAEAVSDVLHKIAKGINRNSNQHELDALAYEGCAELARQVAQQLRGEKPE